MAVRGAEEARRPYYHYTRLSGAETPPRATLVFQNSGQRIVGMQTCVYDLATNPAGSARIL